MDKKKSTSYQGKRYKGKSDFKGGRKFRPKKEEKEETPGIRLNRFIAQSGICSRRQADELITAGLVSVNGKVVTEMGVRVMPGDDVRYNDARIKTEKLTYVVMNKPRDVITTLRDDKGRKTVMDLVRRGCPERIYPVGRLDRNTTGVLLLTNDGDLAKKLAHPKHEKKKIYHVSLSTAVKPTHLDAIRNGIELEDGSIKADAISYIDAKDKKEVGIEIHSGRNRIVRRIFEHFGYKVKKLDRVYFAGLTKKNMSKGQWRFLTEKEISMLKMNAFE